MAFPVRALTRPAVLAGQSNGLLDHDILVPTPGQAGGPTVLLVEPAARAWRALCFAAAQEGHILKATGPHDSFRPFSVQESIFLERYTTTPLPGRPTKQFRGQTFFQRPGTAEAATPGNSNHGWGLAVDTGVESSPFTGTERIDKATLDWLIDNEERFGYSHELQSEPWHIRYFAGDDIPADVSAVEMNRAFGAFVEVDMPLNADDINQIRTAVRSVLDEGTAFGQISWAGTAKDTLASAQSLVTKVNALAAQLNDLNRKVAEIETQLNQ